jgi:hypothetical protein
LSSFKQEWIGLGMDQKSIIQEESLESVINTVKDLITKTDAKIKQATMIKHKRNYPFESANTTSQAIL